MRFTDEMQDKFYSQFRKRKNAFDNIDHEAKDRRKTRDAYRAEQNRAERAPGSQPSNHLGGTVFAKILNN